MSEIPPEVEYEQKWAYLRHIEESRRKSVQLFFVLVGAVASLVATATPEFNSTTYSLGLLVLAFLFGYATYLLGFLVAQKSEYRRHLKRIDALDDTSKGSPDDDPYDPFHWFFSAVVVVASALFGLSVGFGAVGALTLAEKISTDSMIPLAGAVSVAASLLFGVYCRYEYRNELRRMSSN